MADASLLIAGKTMRILLVEDETLLAMSLMEDLTEAGHEMLGPAISIEDAMTIAERTPPELGILNINLRHGKSGIDLARILMERFQCPSLFVSGNVLAAREARDSALGFINKPYRSEVVVQSIEVARQIMSGNIPKAIPDGLELFNKRASRKGA